MIRQIWSLSEGGDDNLGLACTNDGLILGRTPLIEQRDGRYVVRESSEIEWLLSHGYGRRLSVDRLMRGLATVASALNANDQGLARIAAVHLRVPDLPDRAARDRMEAADVLIKYARDEAGGRDWNPALHPRAGTPPIPAGSRRRVVPTQNRLQFERRRTSTRLSVQTPRKTPTTTGCDYRHPGILASISTNYTISWNGLQTLSRRTNGRYEPRSNGTTSTLATSLEAKLSIATSATRLRPVTTSSGGSNC
jgi:hypothetical protein